jgi:hypothetical protein
VQSALAGVFFLWTFQKFNKKESAMADRGKAKKGAEKYLEFLADEGYRPRIDADGDVAFKCEGRSYVIKIDEKDEMFFYLVYPNVWPIKSDEDLSRVMDTALAVTADTKVIKIFPVGDTNTWASIELFCYPPQAFTAAFDRCLRALREGVDKFTAKMQEQPKQTDDFVFHLPKYKVGGN